MTSEDDSAEPEPEPEDEPDYEDALVRRLPNRALLAIPFVGVALALGLAASPHFAMLGLFMAVLAIVSGLRLVRANPRPRLERFPVAVNAKELRIGDERIPRSEIKQALVVPMLTASPVVRLARRRRLPIELVVANAEEGRRLLRALGFDASQVTARFWTASRLLAAPRTWRIGATWALGVGIFAAFRLSPSSYYLVFPLIVLLASLVTIPTPVEVGADGVMIRSIWGRRFVPLGDVERAEAYEENRNNSRVLRGVLLRLRDRTEVKIPVGSRVGDDVSARALLERVREAVDTFRWGNVEGAAALLDRGQRSVPEWIRYLRGVGVGANATMRSAPIAPDRLWRVVESASAKPIDRVAAAVALSARGEADGGSSDDRKRLRVAAEAIAEPKLRVALEAVAKESDEAALEQALEEMAAHK